MDREADKIKELVDKLEKERNLADSEFVVLLSTQDPEGTEYLAKKAGDK